MARGNQRDLARAKNQKKLQEQAKGKKEGDPKKRMEEDAERMRKKQAEGKCPPCASPTNVLTSS